MDIREYLNSNILVTDGAMGTYFGDLVGNIESCEMASVKNPDIIKKIHREYIEAGAKLLRTNTFSANTLSMNIGRSELKELLEASYDIAKEVAGDNAFVGCSIGPLHETRLKKKSSPDFLTEYKFIVDSFIDKGADIFVFETFGSLDFIPEITRYIKSKNDNAFVLVQFAVMADGHTRRGLSVSKIISEMEALESVDSFGFNCGSGPAHIYNILKKLDIFKSNIISVLPNAGYPEIVNRRMVYVNNPEYFSEKITDIVKLGAKIVGGCCGTTPSHIREIVKQLDEDRTLEFKSESVDKKAETVQVKKGNSFKKKLDNKEFVIAVEIDPPFDINIQKSIDNARICKENGVDIVTVADSPRGVARVDSFMVASKIKSDVGIEVMPHICCRDKNMNALKSGIMGAYINGIRNILAITGDPVLDIETVSTKSVFNMNSYQLINMIENLNQEMFGGDEILIGGALNLNVKNKDAQIERMRRKSDKGASIYLTQPIFDDESIEYLSKLDKEGNKILAGIMPVVSYKNAQFLNNELPGIKIPDKYVQMFKEEKNKEKSVEIGINIAKETINKIKPHVDGIYFITPFNRIDIITELIEKTGLK